MDRAHRIGQRRVLHVYRLYVPASIEERVLAGQREKLEVARAVVNDDNSRLTSMHTEGLIDTVAQDRPAAGVGVGVGGAGGLGGVSGEGGGGAVDDDAALDRQYSELDIQTFLRGAGS